MTKEKFLKICYKIEKKISNHPYDGICDILNEVNENTKAKNIFQKIFEPTPYIRSKYNHLALYWLIPDVHTISRKECFHIRSLAWLFFKEQCLAYKIYKQWSN